MFRSFCYCLLGISVAMMTGCSGGGGLAAAGAPGLAATGAENSFGVPAIPQSVASSLSAGIVALADDFSKDAVGGPAVGWNVVSGTWSICQTGSLHEYCKTSN